MLKFIKNIKILLCFSMLLIGCASIKTLHQYYASEDIQLSNVQIKRLNNYLSGEFYSYEINKKVFAYPMVFLISDDGKKSVILACRGILDECNSSIYIYPLIQKYKKKTNLDFKILALGKKIVQRKNNEIINKKKIKYTNLKNDQKNIFFDFIALPSDSCTDEDC